MRRTIVTVLGARPQFVKAAVVSRLLADAPDLTEHVVHTGQHFDASMSQVFFDELGIAAPRHHLGVHSLPHGALTGRMLERIEAVLLAERPDAVLVYGDTDSTLAGALAARKLHLPLVHVEAGLRSFDPRMPEEVNRVLTDRVSDLLCCPTDAAVANLRAEGYDALPCRVARTGDVMYDAALRWARVARDRPSPLARLAPGVTRYALATLHRAENTDDPRRLADALEGLGRVARELPVLLPMHPRTAAAVARAGLTAPVTALPPVGYLDMVALLEGASLVLTDSGGVQKEAFFFRRPCVTLRDTTEWVELVAGGYNRLAGVSPEAVARCAREALDARPDWDVDLYGDGRAGERVVAAVRALLG